MRHSALIFLFCFGCGSACAMTVETPVAKADDLCVDKGAMPCVQTWENMSAEARAGLWPYLDEVSRTMHWRSMSVAERNAMRELLSVNERERLRQRFCSTQVYQAGTSETRRLRSEERKLLRRQIREFHVQRLGAHAGAVGAHTAGSVLVR